ncbi:hypothetical protein OHA27_14485 [Streptomyces sp. NBC_01619]|uniref:hypothetical protein n=1 Tax=unclassified Streptomyces TaxID=2593676 RepID=UPI00225C017B|nr:MULTISPECIES: hypothetical protein [unclassified Streptomyces]MCX4511494.1 hypothetical protein [Streptomyces sp. NBC_01619]
MSEELRGKLLLAKEKKQKAQIAQDLPADVFQGFATDFDTPDWVNEALSIFRRTDSRPEYSTMTENLVDLGSWIESLARRTNLGDELLTQTGLRNFPWLKCSCKSPGWAEALLKTIGRDLTLLSLERHRMIVIFEEEYEYIAFTATSPK